MLTWACLDMCVLCCFSLFQYRPLCKVLSFSGLLCETRSTNTLQKDRIHNSRHIVLTVIFRWAVWPFISSCFSPETETLGITGVGILQAGYASCHVTNSVTALKETQSTHVNQRKSRTGHLYTGQRPPSGENPKRGAVPNYAHYYRHFIREKEGCVIFTPALQHNYKNSNSYSCSSYGVIPFWKNGVLKQI